MNQTDGQAILQSHLRSGRFMAGVASGRWSLIEQDWPFVMIGIKAADGRVLMLRFDCTGYPDTAPTAGLWDMQTRSKLATHRWPKGGRVSQMFNPGWLDGSAIYIPCDRRAIEGHSHWLTEYPWLIWNPRVGLLQYIQAVHETLQSSELQHEPA